MKKNSKFELLREAIGAGEKVVMSKILNRLKAESITEAKHHSGSLGIETLKHQKPPKFYFAIWEKYNKLQNIILAKFSRFAWFKDSLIHTAISQTVWCKLKKNTSF